MDDDGRRAGTREPLTMRTIERVTGRALVVSGVAAFLIVGLSQGLITINL